MKPFITFAALACALAAAPVAAQDAPAHATSVSLGVGGGLTLGVWREASPRVRAGIEAGTRLERTAGDGREDDFTSLAVQPAIKVFSGTTGAVRPYTLAALYAQQSRRRSANEEFDAETEYRYTEAGARLGVGLEWAPASRVAIGGHVGVEGGYLSSEQRNSSPDEERTSDGWTLSTVSSGVVVHLFF